MWIAVDVLVFDIPRCMAWSWGGKWYWVLGDWWTCLDLLVHICFSGLDRYHLGLICLFAYTFVHDQAWCGQTCLVVC
jgi:hypothetical protein